jgi:hypothetical protein
LRGFPNYTISLGSFGKLKNFSYCPKFFAVLENSSEFFSRMLEFFDSLRIFMLPRLYRLKNISFLLKNWEPNKSKYLKRSRREGRFEFFRLPGKIIKLRKHFTVAQKLVQSGKS